MGKAGVVVDGGGLLALQKYRECLSEERFAEAFASAEEALDRYPHQDGFESLVHPWKEQFDGLALRERFSRFKILKILRGLRSFLEANPSSPWPILIQFSFLKALGHVQESLIETNRMARLPRRYQWMRYWSGHILLRCGVYSLKQADRDFLAAYDGLPSVWEAEAFRAELALCEGRTGAAFQIFDRLLAKLKGGAWALALAWRGELSLWSGDYDRSVRDSAAAAQAGAPTAFCWLGASYFKLGQSSKALRSLNIALGLKPEDHEARVWRGEVYRSLGDTMRAFDDFNKVLCFRPPIRIWPAAGGSDQIYPWTPIWALANRARLWGETGQTEKMRSDFKRLPAVVRQFFAQEGGGEGAEASNLSPAILISALEKGFETAKGVRRNDEYLFPLWMRRR